MRKSSGLHASKRSSYVRTAQSIRNNLLPDRNNSILALHTRNSLCRAMGNKRCSDCVCLNGYAFPDTSEIAG